MKQTKINAAVLCLIAVSVLMATSCRTNEKNYRQAYERAVAENDRGVTDFEGTVYNRYRAQVRDAVAQDGNLSVPVKLIRVKVTPDGGGSTTELRKFSVVVGEFKQKFNANSLRSRFAEKGYSKAFLVENAEPYYYVVVASNDDLAEVAAVADSLRVSSPLPLKEGFPYIMQSRY